MIVAGEVSKDASWSSTEPLCQLDCAERNDASCDSHAVPFRHDVD